MDGVVFLKHIAASLLRNEETQSSDAQWFGFFQKSLFLFQNIYIAISLCLTSSLKSQLEQTKMYTYTLNRT